MIEAVSKALRKIPVEAWAGAAAGLGVAAVALVMRARRRHHVAPAPVVATSYVTPPTPAPSPLIHVRVHVIAAAEDDGSSQSPATAAGVAADLAAANVIYAPAGIVFEYDPGQDFETISSSLLNHDCLMAAADTTAPAGAAPPCDAQAPVAERTRVAALHPDRATVIFRSFNKGEHFDPVACAWHDSNATGGFSSSTMPFVVVSGHGSGSYLAHELGHYLHLSHTFGKKNPKTIAEAGSMIARHVGSDSNRVPRGLDIFDGDLGTVQDTAPDPGTDIWATLPGGICGPTDSVPVPVTFDDGSTSTYTLAPPRTNPMSYFKSCHLGSPLAFSPQQIQRMRDALLTGNRQGVAYTGAGGT